MAQATPRHSSCEDSTKMRATLIHNPKAGTSQSADGLVARLLEIGWEVVRRVASRDADASIARGVDVVVVAGGDGTIGTVAPRLMGTEIPLAIIPMGTANNVARSLRIGVDAEAAITALANATLRRVDIGRITEEGEPPELFIEGVGLGIFAHVLGERAETARAKRTMAEAMALIADELEAYVPVSCELELDGRKVSGSYVLAAIMNMQSVGPALGVAPAARCDDGELDVVLVGPESRAALLRRLRSGAGGAVFHPPDPSITRARHVRVRGYDLWLHADDRSRQLKKDVTIDVAEGALRILAQSP
jgi:diacylglycerol kinase (ATP)